MRKLEILSVLTEALEQDQFQTQYQLAKNSLAQYNQMIKEQNSLLKEISSDQPSENGEAPNELRKEEIDFLIEELASSFKYKEEKYLREVKRNEEREHLKAKKSVIERLRSLISEEENIGKAFVTFNELQDEWNSIGDVPSEDYHTIQSEYSRLRESFYYNIKIYKELADHDKKKNLERKQAIIEQVKELNKEKSVNKQNTQIRALIKEWDSIGITFEENWNTLREEFWTHARTILNRVDNHYKDLREKASVNLELKKGLVEKARAVLAYDNTTNSHWKKSSEKLINIQKDWKKIGVSENNEGIWQEFRAICDEFFDKKKVFYEKLSEQNLEVEEVKNELIRQSEILKESEDWKESTKAILSLQEKWKKAGSTNPRRENQLWKSFRSNLDYFFKKKQEFFAGKEDREKDNLKKKEALIEEIKAFELSGNAGQDIPQLKEFANRWHDIGFIPFNKKDKVYGEYKNALDAKYDKLKMDSNEKAKIRFQSKVDSLKSQKDPEKAIQFESRRIRRQIEELNAKVRQTENNMGFFNTSNGNGLLDDINKKLNKDKQRIEELKQQLTALRKA